MVETVRAPICSVCLSSVSSFISSSLSPSLTLCGLEQLPSLTSSTSSSGLWRQQGCRSQEAGKQLVPISPGCMGMPQNGGFHNASFWSSLAFPAHFSGVFSLTSPSLCSWFLPVGGVSLLIPIISSLFLSPMDSYDASGRSSLPLTLCSLISPILYILFLFPSSYF